MTEIQILFTPLVTIVEAFESPPPSCSVVKFRFTAQPGRKRRRFGQALACLSEETGIQFHGFIRRTSTTTLECLIVVEPCEEKDLGPLYVFLRNRWHCSMADITFEKTNNDHANRLQRRFEIVQGRDENEGWSGAGFENENNSTYSFVTHITDS